MGAIYASVRQDLYLVRKGEFPLVLPAFAPDDPTWRGKFHVDIKAGTFRIDPDCFEPGHNNLNAEQLVCKQFCRTAAPAVAVTWKIVTVSITIESGPVFRG